MLECKFVAKERAVSPFSVNQSLLLLKQKRHRHKTRPTSKNELFDHVNEYIKEFKKEKRSPSEEESKESSKKMMPFMVPTTSETPSPTKLNKETNQFQFRLHRTLTKPMEE